jgi:acetylornithine aminotransferase
LGKPCRDLALIAARDHGLLINITRSTTIRLLPPLIIDEQDVDSIISGVCKTLETAWGA